MRMHVNLVRSEALVVAEVFIVVAVSAALAVLVVSSVVLTVLAVLTVLDVIGAGVNRSFQEFSDLKIIKYPCMIARVLLFSQS
jgi:hypothetical protein